MGTVRVDDGRPDLSVAILVHEHEVGLNRLPRIPGLVRDPERVLAGRRRAQDGSWSSQPPMGKALEVALRASWERLVAAVW
jgi:hypothetical protein